MLDAKLKLKLLFDTRPWETEPDLEEWEYEATGYKCKVFRHPKLLHLNGYVGIPKEHRAYGWAYDDERLHSIDVHGGLTYASEGEDGYWWFGFDTSHAGDLNIGVILSLLEVHKDRDMNELIEYRKGETYRDFAYVKNEVITLAYQLEGLKNGYQQT